MKSKDIFILAVRVLGLVFLYHGLSSMPTILPLAFARSIGNWFISVIMVAWPLVLAYWLVRGAPLLIRIAFSETSGHSETDQDIAGPSPLS